jgi:hypothetical protein
MNIVTVLHNKAMEFADEALLAKMEGNTKASEALFEKAFSLEREAATSVDEQDKNSDTWFILVRSAAALALKCGKYQEAGALIRAGLEGNPPKFVIKELHALEKELQAVLNEKVNQVELVGVIIYANADESEIRLQDIQTKELFHITVPRQLINDIVKSYWADIVQVKVSKTSEGAIFLDEITRAA